MRLYIIAMQFLTIIPLPFNLEWRKNDLGRSLVMFPLAGLTIGAFLAGLNWLIAPFLARPLTDALLITVLAAVTGALHMDGLADVCDGIAAQESRQDGAAMLGLIANPASHSRQRLYAYLDVIIARYKSRQSVAMWEITNELTNLADIGVRKGVPAPTLTQVAEFFDSVAKHIKVDDPLRLVSTGGSHLREYAWNLFLGHGWRQRDTLAEQRKAFAAYFQKSAVDVIDIHYYAIHTGGYELARDVDGQPVFMTPPRYTHVAHELGKGIILGEYGALPYGFDGPRKNTKTNDNWFVGYNDATAKHWVQRATDSAVNSGVQLVYFWTYQSDRPQDQKSNPVTYSIAYTPELVQIIVDGNRRLKEKLNAH